MRKTIRTADEEMNGVITMLLFAVIWYASLLRNIWLSGFHTGILVFLVAGILPLAQAVRTIRKAVYYRRFHEQCVAQGRPERGRIVNITREYYDNYDARNRRHRITYYFLTIEVYNQDTGLTQTIKSEPYRIPIYKYLGSPYVQVYTDQTGWKHVVDGFQLKNSRRDPDIPLENSNVYLKDFNQPSGLFQVIFVIILVLMLFQIFRN